MRRTGRVLNVCAHAMPIGKLFWTSGGPLVVGAALTSRPPYCPQVCRGGPGESGRSAWTVLVVPPRFSLVDASIGLHSSWSREVTAG